MEPLFTPLFEALTAHQATASHSQADETRWAVFCEREGKQGYRWWLWAFFSDEVVVFRLDPSRSHDVPEQHFPADAQMVLMVDRYAGYKAMAQVKAGHVLLAFCWAHVRRDFVEVGKGWKELTPWALAWLGRIAELYRLNRRRLSADVNDRRKADACLRTHVASMRGQCDQELSDEKLREPCRKVLTSLVEHWEGLTRFVVDARIPLDNNRSERGVRGPAVGRKNYYGSGSEWSGRLAAKLFSIFATLSLWRLNVAKWLSWYLDGCAKAGGAPSDVSPFLPWNLSAEQLTEFASDSASSSTDTRLPVGLPPPADSA